MKMRAGKSLFVVTVCLTLFSALYVWSIRAAIQREVKLPKVISKIKSIEVINVKVEGEHSLVVTLRNNSEKPVVAITLETGGAKDGDGVTAAGYKENDEPDSVIIKPHETYDVDMPLGYVRPDGVVKVSGVIYADDTGEGDKAALELMRDQKKQMKSERLKREGGGPRRLRGEAGVDGRRLRRRVAGLRPQWERRRGRRLGVIRQLHRTA